MSASKPNPSRLKKIQNAFKNSAKNEWRFLRQNPWDFAVMVWLPLLTILLVWWIFAKNNVSDLPIHIIDQDHSASSQTLIRYLDASPDLRVTAVYPSANNTQSDLAQQKVYGIFVIEPDFEKHLLQGKTAHTALQVNAQYGTYSGIVQKGVQSVVGTFSAGVEIKRLIKQGANPNQAKIDFSPISIQRISLFKLRTDYQQFLASTVIPALLHIFSMVIGATTIGREIKEKRLGSWYAHLFTNVSPNPNKLIKAVNPNQTYQSADLLVILAGLYGKYSWAMIFFALWSGLAIGLMAGKSEASLGTLILTWLNFELLFWVSFWLGAIFTLNSYSLRMGLSTTGFISAPSYAFSGVTFPYIAMSDYAKYWADALPLTHYLKVQIGLVQMNTPLFVALPTVFGFLLASLGLSGLAAILCRRDLAHPEKWGKD